MLLLGLVYKRIKGVSFIKKKKRKKLTVQWGRIYFSWNTEHCRDERKVSFEMADVLPNIYFF